MTALGQTRKHSRSGLAQHRTSSRAVATSVQGQMQTHAPQQSSAYSMTSSARETSDSGRVSPITFAAYVRIFPQMLQTRPIREAAFPSLAAPLRLVPAPVDPTDGIGEREASGQRRILQCGNRKTNVRPARSSGLSDARWRRSVSRHADLASYRSSRCDRIARIGEDETTICRQPGIRRSRFRSALAPG